MLNRWISPLIDPRVEFKRPDEARKARTVAALLLVISSALVFRTAVVSANRLWFIPFVLISIAAYGLARTRYYMVAGWTIIISLALPSYLRALTLSGQDTPTELMTRFSWLAFSLVLGGLILSYQGMLLLIALNIGATLLVAWLLPGADWITVIPVIGYVGFLGALILIAEHQRALMEMDRHTQDLRRERQLDEVTRAISSALDLSTVLQTVARTATELVAAEAGMLSLLAPEGDHLETVLGYNMPAAQINSRPPKGQGLAWQVIETGRPILLDNYRSHPNALTSITKDGIRAYLGVPILAGETCLGALAVGSLDRKKHFSARDLEMMEAVARQAGIAIQNARLYASLQSELTERRRVETILLQREAILEAVASAARQFLQSQDWQRYIQTVLAELGQITHSSHAYIFQNHLGLQGQMVTTQIYQWTAPQAESTLGRVEFQNVPLEGTGLERWQEAMRQGEPYYGSRSTWQPAEALYLGPLGAHSVLEMPVYLQGEPGHPGEEPSMEWWGLIGFDDYTAERVWSPAEVDAIKIAATILSAAIQRQRADQALQEREAIYRRAISTADAVPYYYIYNPLGYAFIGEGVLLLTGYTTEEMTPELWNQRVEQAIPQGEARGLTEQQAIQLARDGKLPDWRCEYLFRRPDGELRWIADTGVELVGPDGKSHGCIGILQDITARKQAEEAARQANLVLEKRVQERTAALQLANKELEAFAYSVSHDLRAPLRAVDGYSRILLEDYQGRLDADGQACLDNVRQATRKMNQLIDDLLQLSRVTRQEMNAVQVNLSALAAELLEAHARQEDQRQVQVSVQPGLEAVGDPNLLRIMLENLLSNAWKFTRHTQNACIQVGQLPAGAGESAAPVYFVRDNGAGFDMQYAEKLFQPFQRLHRPDEFEGTGVGLATTQRIVRRHNGRLWAEAAPNQGATFYFTLETFAEWEP